MPTVDDDFGHDPLSSDSRANPVDDLNDGGGYDEAAMKEESHLGETLIMFINYNVILYQNYEGDFPGSCNDREDVTIGK